MKGSYLNQERNGFLSSLETLVEELHQKVVNARADYSRFDEYDEYRDDYYREYLQKTANARIAIFKIMEAVDE